MWPYKTFLGQPWGCHGATFGVVSYFPWVTHGSDRWGNPTYKRDEDGFLLANFRHLKANIDEPYVFPVQVQQVFLRMNLTHHGGK